jgi:hypothetical protein
MMQTYTKTDLERAKEIARELHGLRGFEVWAENCWPPCLAGIFPICAASSAARASELLGANWKTVGCAVQS